MSVETEYDPDGMKESLGALIGMDGRQVEGDLERFRDLVEAREVPTGAWRGEINSGEVVEDDRTGISSSGYGWHVEPRERLHVLPSGGPVVRLLGNHVEHGGDVHDSRHLADP